MLYNHTTQSQGKGRFQVCYLALYHNFTLEMSFLLLHNSSWTKGRRNWAPDPELPLHKAVTLAQQSSEIIWPLDYV